MTIEDFIGKRFDDFWDKNKVNLPEKVHASQVVQEGYSFICKKIKAEHKELTPQAVTDINLLEGFLITFIQHANDFEQLRKIEAIIG